VTTMFTTAKSRKDNVNVTPLPSMIRVDAAGKMEAVYDEISEALGKEPGYFDSAEYLGFELTAV
jgi:propane monooxygenase coupling protein